MLAGMCLILLALGLHPDVPLVLAANRDELFERPTAPAAAWQNDAGIVAGRDLRSGGTWLGMAATGRLAAVTNYREPLGVPAAGPSRGELVLDYLQGDDEPDEHLRALHARAHGYAGFNLLVGTTQRLWYYGNREGRVRRCEPGVHGLSNHLLDTPWPKVTLGKTRLAALLRSSGEAREVLVDRLLSLLDDGAVAPDAQLPRTGLARDEERALSAMRISAPGYGTRSSSVLLVDGRGTLHLTERTLAVGGQAPADRHFSLPARAASPCP
jgi:uncharacterized protein with NRDE domain